MLAARSKAPTGRMAISRTQLQPGIRTVARRATVAAAAAAAAAPDTNHPETATPFGTAVVLGSGIAGLAAAAALADQFAEVVVLEADSEPAGQSLADVIENSRNPRPGVAQYRQLHTLLGRGRAELEQLLPGFTLALVAAGARAVDGFKDTAFSSPAGFFAPVPSPRQPIEVILASRHLLETVTRRLVSANPRVSIRYRSKAAGLVVADSGRRVSGVRLTSGEAVAAELVVVAAGRKSAVADWLREAGQDLPPVSTVQAETGYTTCYFTLPKHVSAALPYRSGMYGLHGAPLTPSGCYIQRIDRTEDGDDVWVAGAQGYCGKYPKATWEDMMLFAQQSVYNKELAELLPHAEHIGQPLPFYRSGNTWIHFEQKPPSLGGVLVIGDAYCALNPVYGQGMTVAAMEVNILRRALAAAAAAGPHGLDGLAAAFYPEAGRVIQDAWLLAAGRDSDCPWVTMQGEQRSWLTGLLLRYVNSVFTVAAVDEEVSEVMQRVLNMVDPASAILTPRMVARVVLHSLRQFTSPQTAQAAAGGPFLHPARKSRAAAADASGTAAETGGGVVAMD